MATLLFFLLGIPAAFLAERLIFNLTNFEDGDDEEDEGPIEVKQLPWQGGAWQARVRVGLVAFIPVLTALAGSRFDPPQALAVSALVVALIVCTATDLLRYRVPNVVTYPGIILALAAAMVMPEGDLKTAVVAAVGGGLLFLVMAVVTRGGLGLGDVKLAVLIGAALGLRAGYEALLLGVAAGGLIILLLFVSGLVHRRQAVPYAPFLALAAVAIVLLRGAAFAPL
jgi:prepilin signal peptidase PulO-like enzyme (type II secretory pathway)